MTRITRLSLLLSGLLPIGAQAADNARLLEMAVFSTGNSWLADRTLVEGNAGSNAYVEIGSTTRLAGNLVSGGNAFVRSRGTVAGDVTLAQTLVTQDGATVQGTLTENATVEAISLDNPAVVTGSVSNWIQGGQTVDLAPGAYDVLGAQAGSTVRLVAGSYAFSNFMLEPGAQLLVDVSAGPVRIDIAQWANIADRCQVVVTGGEADQLRFHSAGSGMFRIGTDVKFQGIVDAPAGEIHVYSRTEITGALWAKDVFLEPDVLVHQGVHAPVATGSIKGSVLDGYVGNVEAHFTADNHYGLYHGRADGSNLVFEGRNEFGDYDANGHTLNWQAAEDYRFSVNPDDHLYVVAWNDYAYQMWAGQFKLNTSGLIVSNTSDWEYVDGSGTNPYLTAAQDVPATTTVSSDIASAQWKPLQYSAVQGTYPWSYIQGLDASAKYVWSDVSYTSGTPAHYVIFRSKNPVIPRVALPTWTVFVDANDNGALDAGEPVTTTVADGSYAFANLAAGSYVVRQVPQAQWQQVAPAANAAIRVTLQPGETLEHNDFLLQHD